MGQPHDTVRNRKMQATLIRFGPDLLAVVRSEADRTGVSVAQYVREAVLARIAYTAGRRGDDSFDAALDEVTAGTDVVRSVRAENKRLRVENQALVAETAQARAQAVRVRERAAQARRHAVEARGD
jgi:hypothetical protein